jgi:hypothetical protein
MTDKPASESFEEFKNSFSYGSRSEVCHVSVGHLARVLEEAGLATVVIGTSAFRDRLSAMQLPRTVITRHPMGRPLGAPNDRETQRKVILTALELLGSASQSGAIVDLSDSYRPLSHQDI